MIRYVFFISLLGFSVATATEAQETFPYTAQVTANSVKLRAGQNENFENIGILNAGDQLTVVAESFDWRKIKLPVNAKVYVHNSFVKDLGDGVGEVTGNRLNIRAAPATSASVVSQLKKGELVRLLEKKDDWYLIEPPEESFGWVKKDFLQPVARQVFAPRVVQRPIRNVYVKKRMAQNALQPNSVLSLTGTVSALASQTDSQQVRNRLSANDGQMYDLMGYRQVLDSFTDQHVKIEGQFKADFQSEHPVVLVTKITLVL